MSLKVHTLLVNGALIQAVYIHRDVSLRGNLKVSTESPPDNLDHRQGRGDRKFAFYKIITRYEFAILFSLFQRQWRLLVSLMNRFANFLRTKYTAGRIRGFSFSLLYLFLVMVSDYRSARPCL